MRPGTEPGIVVSGLSFSYGSSAVFQDFELEPRSNIVVLTGPSGSGKTTLLKLCAGVLAPARACTMPPATDTCLILQEDGLLPWLSGFDNLTRIADCTEAEITQHPLFATVKPLLDARVHRLSYGQRRIIELFRAICRKPRYLYLDEPANYLDIEKRQLVLQVLKEAYATFGHLVCSTHHRDEVDLLGGEVFRFDGRFPIRTLQKA